MGRKNTFAREARDKLQIDLTQAYNNKVKCPVCGKIDNDWKSRRGLCCECYCFLLNNFVDVYEMTYQETIELLASDTFGGNKALTADDIERYGSLETGQPFLLLMKKYGTKHKPSSDILQENPADETLLNEPIEAELPNAEISIETETQNMEKAAEAELTNTEMAAETTVEVSVAEEPLQQPLKNKAPDEQTEHLTRYMKYYRRNREKILERRRLRRLEKSKEASTDETFARAMDSAWEKLQTKKALTLSQAKNA